MATHKIKFLNFYFLKFATCKKQLATRKKQLATCNFTSNSENILQLVKLLYNS